MKKTHHFHSKIKQKKKVDIFSLICLLLIAGAVLFLLYYHVLQPYLSNQATDRYRNIYHAEVSNTEDSGSNRADNENLNTESTEDSSLTDASVDASMNTSSASVLRFQELSDYNPDICAWITIPGTNIDYPVVQSTDADDMAYYLTHNLDGGEDKNGSLLIDYRTPLQKNSKNTVINGHNMKSTGLMFRDLVNYNKLSFYQENPIINLDSIYGNSQWKIFALIKTNNNEKHGERFLYFRDDFTSDMNFMDFVYQLEVRSIYSCPVMINENDSLLILSTCTYELDDMRLLVVARKVRANESTKIDTSDSYVKDEVLYPDAWYDTFPGTRPDVTSFEEAYNAGELTWYDGSLFH